jgi:hypothetical protein
VVAAQRPVLERVRVVARLLEVALDERVLVDDQHRVAGDLREVRLERRRVHRNQDVGVVAGRLDVAGGEVDLERRHARRGARRGADLGREVRQRGQVVSRDGGRIGEPATYELHAVARVAGEPDDQLFLLYGPGGSRAGVSPAHVND